MTRFLAALAVSACLAAAASAARSLDIYFIDVEGGQSTLVVTPAGQSLLIDSGFPAGGGFDAVPGDPATARDANRIRAAARAAGLSRIDYFLNTHFHADHDGGIVELAQLMPIGTYIDHGKPMPNADNVAGTLKMFDAYAATRAKGKHFEPKPGERLPLQGVDAVVVSAAGSTIATALRGGGAKTAQCPERAPDAEEANENPRSTGIRLAYGQFTFLDVGDLSGAPLHALACPVSLIGPVDVYLVAHHGGPDARDRSTLNAFAPRVAIVNNGERKGGVRSLLEALRAVPSIDVFQLHRRTDAGDANADAARIANLDENTAHWILVRADQDGSFSVTNGRTGASKTYPKR